MTERNWGAYCAQCNVWVRKSDHTLVYYPSPELMRADLETDLGMPGVHFDRQHSFEVTEFGKEHAIKPEEVPPGTAQCPVIVERLNQQALRAMWAKECA